MKKEEYSQRICNFYYDSTKKSIKPVVNYFKKQYVRQSMTYYILKKYLQYGTTKDLSRSGRSLKLSKKNLNNIVKSVNNRCGLSQRKTARRFKVHYSTISHNLQRRTSIVIRKRRKAPKMDNEQQQVQARKNCSKLYRKLSNGCDLIMDDEKYFKLTGNNVVGNHYFYSTDVATGLTKVKFQCKTKLEAKMMIWMGMSFKGTSDIYVHKSKQAVNQETNVSIKDYCLKYHSNGNYLFWPKHIIQILFRYTRIFDSKKSPICFSY